MNRQFVGILLFFGLVLTIGCEKEIKLDLPDEQRLVLLSSFSPDSLFRVSLATTLSINETVNQLPDYPDNASIQLFENGNYLEDLNFKAGNGYILPSYSIDFKPKENAHYSIEATVPDYPSVTASNTIPSAVGIEKLESFDVSVEETSPGVFYYSIFANVEIAEKADTLQYFHLLAWRTINERARSISVSPLDNSDNQILHEDGFLFNSDELLAASKSLDIEVVFNYDSNIEAKSPIQIELRNVTEDYYRFHESVGEQEFASGVNQGVLSTEAYFIYNNIEGGIGNFSGYSSVIDSIGY